MQARLVCLLLLAAQAQPQRPVIKSGVTYVETTVVVRDDHGQFVQDLAKGDFEVYEDGVRQELATFALAHGGRLINEVPSGPAAPVEGLLLPPMRPTSDVSGRVFLIFIDDQHFEPRQTAAVRQLLKDISTLLLHDGDLFGVVSTGTSSIAVDMTYDRKQLTRAIEKVMGNGLLPAEIIGSPDGSQGPPEVRHRAHVAFSTAYEILQKMGQVHNRRKALVYISNGYDFDPFPKSRARAAGERFSQITGRARDTGDVPDVNPFSRSGNEFAAADLSAELAELTREANRANVAIYTIDPRGLVGGPDIDQRELDLVDWQDHVRETQSSLRVIADLTGGIAAVNTNNLAGAIKRIDNDTSSNYVVGYYSSNPDPMRKRRTIEIRISAEKRRQKHYQLSYKTSYTLKPAR
jgi:VWFA-related protein